MYIKNNVVCQCDEKNQCRWNMEVCHAFKWERYQYSYRQFFHFVLEYVADAPIRACILNFSFKKFEKLEISNCVRDSSGQFESITLAQIQANRENC